MGEMQTMARTRIAINEAEFLLAQGQSLEELKRRIDKAVHAGGGFVDFVVVGNRTVSILVSAWSHVVISAEIVEFDPQENGGDTEPYGGAYDLL